MVTYFKNIVSILHNILCTNENCVYVAESSFARDEMKHEHLYWEKIIEELLNELKLPKDYNTLKEIIKVVEAYQKLSSKGKIILTLICLVDSKGKLDFIKYLNLFKSQQVYDYSSKVSDDNKKLLSDFIVDPSPVL